jgi:hypothetical protein
MISNNKNRLNIKDGSRNANENLSSLQGLSGAIWQSEYLNRNQQHEDAGFGFID